MSAGVRVFVAPPLPDGYATLKGDYMESSAESSMDHIGAALREGAAAAVAMIPDVTIPQIHRDYWNQVEARTIGRHRAPGSAEGGDAMAMDTGDDGDDGEGEVEGEEQGGGGGGKEERGERRTIHELFHEMRKEIDTSGSPVCIVSQDQKVKICRVCVTPWRERNFDRSLPFESGWSRSSLPTSWAPRWPTRGWLQSPQWCCAPEGHATWTRRPPLCRRA